MPSQPPSSSSFPTEKNKNGVQVRFDMYNMHDCNLISVSCLHFCFHARNITTHTVLPHMGKYSEVLELYMTLY